MRADHIDGASQNTKMELAKALLAVKSVASDEVYQQIHSILVEEQSDVAVRQAIRGLSKEDEFALMCRLMGTATHLVHLEQRPVIKGDFLVPDFLARFQPGCTSHRKPSSQHAGFRCLIEVKTTSKMRFKVGGKKLKLLRAFADQFGLPLLFAIKYVKFDHAALWTIVEDSDRSRNSLAITVDALTEGGIRNVIWDDYMFMVMPDIYFRYLFDSSPGLQGGVQHSQYGRLQEFHIVFPKELSVSGSHIEGNVARYTGTNAAVLSAFFEGFHPVERLVEHQGNSTVQVLVPSTPCSLADMVFSFNRLPRDNNGRIVLDPSRIIAGSDDDKWLASREFIERVASDLWGSVLGMLTFGPDELHLKKWQDCGGRK